MKHQCAVLIVNPAGSRVPQGETLSAMGFAVTRSAELPRTERLLDYHVVIVLPHRDEGLPMLGARIRAKPCFGHRVLIALTDVTDRTRRAAVASGFTAVLPLSTSGRALAVLVLRVLRRYPEFQCVLRPRPNAA